MELKLKFIMEEMKEIPAVCIRTWEGIDRDGGILAGMLIPFEKLRLQFILKTNFRFRTNLLQEFFAKDCKNKGT